jgi:predicted GIY-YIG superfamily endonuclease
VPIDKCMLSFSEFSSVSMPSIMGKLRHQMQQLIPMSTFATPGDGKAAILSKLKMKLDFKGCYVLIDKDRPIYVGISQSVIQRLQQHVKGKTHYNASLAYRMAMEKVPHETTREEAMQNGAFTAAFVQSKEYIRGLYVAFIEIKNAVELYLFELYCSLELDTDKWNTFETH